MFNSDGTVSRTSETDPVAASSVVLATGVYEVKLDSAGDVTACSFTANVDHDLGAGGHGTADVGVSPGSSNRIAVRTFDAAGVAALLPFHLQVMC